MIRFFQNHMTELFDSDLKILESKSNDSILPKSHDRTI